MSTDSLGNENIDMAVGYSNGYKKGYEDGKKDAVKHGNWIFENELVSGIKCSACNSSVFWMNAKRPNYCPSCGAKMDGDKND